MNTNNIKIDTNYQNILLKLDRKCHYLPNIIIERKTKIFLQYEVYFLLYVKDYETTIVCNFCHALNRDVMSHMVLFYELPFHDLSCGEVTKGA